jgi:hypothetical protein
MEEMKRIHVNFNSERLNGRHMLREKHKQEHNINIGFKCDDRIYVNQDSIQRLAFVSTVVNIWVVQTARDFDQPSDC